MGKGGEENEQTSGDDDASQQDAASVSTIKISRDTNLLTGVEYSFASLTFEQECY